MTRGWRRESGRQRHNPVVRRVMMVHLALAPRLVVVVICWQMGFSFTQEDDCFQQKIVPSFISFTDLLFFHGISPHHFHLQKKHHEYNTHRYGLHY